jgi:hypothetical protein
MNRYLSIITCVSLSLFSSQCKADLDTDLPEFGIEGTTPEVGSVEHCAGILFGSKSGEGNTESSVTPVSQSGWTKKIVSQDSEFVKLVYAVVYVESKFNPEAKSDKEAYGLMQMTSAAVIDASKHCSLRPIPDMNHLFDAKTNIQYGSCYLRKLLDETDGDTVRALVAYNGGYKALTVYDREGNLNQETANYVLKVNQALKKCTVPTKQITVGESKK